VSSLFLKIISEINLTKMLVEDNASPYTADACESAKNLCS
jgi:hypothetical protein